MSSIAAGSASDSFIDCFSLVDKHAPAPELEFVYWRAVQAREIHSVEHQCDGAEVPASIAVQEQRPVGEARRERRVVQARDDRPPGVSARAEALQHFDLVMWIEMIGSLIEQEHGRVLRED